MANSKFLLIYPNVSKYDGKCFLPMTNCIFLYYAAPIQLYFENIIKCLKVGDLMVSIINTPEVYISASKCRFYTTLRS